MYFISTLLRYSNIHEIFQIIDVIEVLVNTMLSGRLPYLGI